MTTNIHFDFIVSDIDAETIFDSMREQFIRCCDEVVKESNKPTPDKSVIDWWNKRSIYLEGVMEKMKNRPV